MADKISEVVSCFTSSSEEYLLTETQLAVSQLFQSFCKQATDRYMLCGMMVGGMLGTATKAYSARYLSSISFFQKSNFGMAGAQGFSFVASCMTEALGMHSLPVYLRGEPTLEGKFGEGWRGYTHTTLTIMMMKMTGCILPKDNMILQHLGQDVLMVALDSGCAIAGLTEATEGNFWKKVCENEVVSWQMMASGCLTKQFFPSVAMFEAKQSLNYDISGIGKGWLKAFGLRGHAVRSVVTPEGIVLSVAEKSGGKEAEAEKTHVRSSGLGDWHGISLESSGGERAVSAESTPPKAKESLNAYFEAAHGSQEYDRAIEMIKQDPEGSRTALIGMTNLPYDRLVTLRGILNPELQLLTCEKIQRVLIANRGEIAVRIARTLHEMGITPVLRVTESEIDSYWAQTIIQEYKGEVGEYGLIKRKPKSIGKAGKTVEEITADERGALREADTNSFQEAYLNMNEIVTHAVLAGVDAIHPGYGYLSENVDFSRRLREAGKVLIGPSVETVDNSGDKDKAKAAFKKAGVPVVPGTVRGYTNMHELVAEIRSLNLSYPIRLKAVAGGGGRGQRTVYSEAELFQVFDNLSAEARKAFSNGEIMAELAIESYNHVEVQLFGDSFGNVVHYGERECTLQERSQKLIEIHPAAIFDRHPRLRERLFESAVKAGKSINYTGHGTAEFLVNPETGDFYIMEINARIQVEHRVTEEVNPIDDQGRKLDLIHDNILIAQGLPLPRSQAQIRPIGAAVEIRLKGVNPNRRTKDGVASPAPGIIGQFSICGTTDFASLRERGIFVEVANDTGDFVGNADPMFAKVIVTGKTREDALRMASSVLDHPGTVIEGDPKRPGFSSDLERQRRLLHCPTVLDATYDNNFFGQWVADGTDHRALHRKSQAIFIRPTQTEKPAWVHLEVGTHEFGKPLKVLPVEEAFYRLIRGEEKGAEFSLTGPLAACVRRDPSLREMFLSVDHHPNRKVWAQASDRGIIEQIFIFENNRPVKMLFAQYTRGYRRALEMAGEINFDSMGTENPVPKMKLYNEAGQTLHSDVTAEKVNDTTFLFLKPIQGKSPQMVQLKLHSTASQVAVEVSNADGNIIAALSPHEVVSPKDFSFFYKPEKTLPSYLQRQHQVRTDRLIRSWGELPAGSEAQEAVVRELSALSLPIGRIYQIYQNSPSPAERAFLERVLVERNLLERNSHGHYSADSLTSVTYFSEADAPSSPARVLVRRYAYQSSNIAYDLGEALKVVEKHDSNPDQVIEVMIKRPSKDHSPYDLLNNDALSAELHQTLNQTLSANADLIPRLKRVTFIVDQNGEMPDHLTFRPKAQGEKVVFEEDLNCRGYHPFDGVYLLEIRRLKGFTLQRDAAHSTSSTHLLYGVNKPKKDSRLFGTALVSEARVVRDGSGSFKEVSGVEVEFAQLLEKMNASLGERAEKERPKWNRLFVNILPILDATPMEIGRHAEYLATKYTARLTGLALEKTVVKFRLRDDAAPEGYRVCLMKITNPTGYKYEMSLSNLVKASVVDGMGLVRTREVLLTNGDYLKWKKDPAVVLKPKSSSAEEGDIEWAPADVPIRTRSNLEQRIQQARTTGSVFAYDLPKLIGHVAEEFRVEHGLETAQDAALQMEGHPPSNTKYVELDLDSATVSTDPKTGKINYKKARLSPAVDEKGKPRLPGQNKVGLAFFDQTDDLGIGEPVRRVVIKGDLTHESRGSLDISACERIIAAIRYARQEKIPIDWFPAATGVVIDPVEGVEHLRAAAKVAKYIVRLCKAGRVPMNIIVDEVNIGAQSYWNALATIIEDTGGILIMTPRGSMALTGPDALTAALLSKVHSEDLRAQSKKIYPNGLQDLAGYETVHGPNGDAMLKEANLKGAIKVLMRHHYFTYTSNGELVTRKRPLGARDSRDRDITQILTKNGRTVGDEIESIRTGSIGDRKAILMALHDEGAPEPIQYWKDATGIKGQPMGNGLMPQKPTVLVYEMQIGGIPQLVIFPPIGAMTPADSEIIARAQYKANGRIFVRDLGSMVGFGADPRSMENRQLLWGAKMLVAKVQRRGPYEVDNLGYLVGGTHVVEDAILNPHLELYALQGARNTVIGGASAAKVVFRNDIRRIGVKLLGALKTNLSPADLKDPVKIVQETKNILNENKAGLEAEEMSMIHSEKAAQMVPEIFDLKAESFSGDKPNEELQLLQSGDEGLRRWLILLIERRAAAVFDSVHTVERAVEVKVMKGILKPSELRRQLIHNQERAMRKFAKAEERKKQKKEGNV